MKLELIPLLIIALLLISTGGAEVETAEFIIEGDLDITEHRGALIVGDATVTVPPDADVSGPIYVIGGELHIEGTVSGDVTQLSGSLVVDDEAAIDGRLQHIAGTEDISDDARIAERTNTEVAPAEPSPVGASLPTVLTTVILALGGAWLSQRRPTLLDNVGTTAREHTLVSLTVGGLVFVTFLSLFVFMAFTLVLIPVAILGLLIGAVIIAYGVVSLGYLIGQQMGSPRTGLATSAGTVVVMLLLEVSSVIPFVGDLLAIGFLLTGFGAVVLTYFGLRQFEPIALPE